MAHAPLVATVALLFLFSLANSQYSSYQSEPAKPNATTTRKPRPAHDPPRPPDAEVVEPNGVTRVDCEELPPSLRDLVNCPMNLPEDRTDDLVLGYEKTSEVYINDDPMQNSELFEGDIRVPDSDEPTSPKSKGKRNSTRGVIADDLSKWPDAVIPYVIDSSYGEDDVAFIKKAMCRFYSFSCIRFKPRTNEDDFVKIKQLDGCWSRIGLWGGKQLLSLTKFSNAPACLVLGTPEHELMHALGFLHEQSRLDRATTVNFFKENVQPDFVDSFAQFKPTDYDDFGQKYDTGSIMHYGSYAFSIQPGVKPTMLRLDGSLIEQSQVFSDSDKFRINAAYPCPSPNRPDDSSFDMTCSSLDRGTDSGPDPARNRRPRRRRSTK